MLVLAFFDDAGLNDILATLRSSSLPSVKLKAVLTETNRQWNCGRLYRELKSEQEALKK